MRFLFFVLLLLTTEHAARAAWTVAESAHFIIYSEDKPDKLRRFATELERFDAAIRLLQRLPSRPDSANNKLTVFMVDDVAAVQRLSGGGAGVAGFYSGRAGGSVAFVPRRAGSGRGDLKANNILLHEYTHHFLFRNMPAAFPIWFSEGFAEFYSTARFNEDGSIDFGLPAQHRSTELFSFASIPIKQLLTADFSRMTFGQVVALYGRGWLLTHYLQFAPDRRGQLQTYLSELNKGRSSVEAASTAFKDLDQLGRDLERYKSSKLSYVRLSPAKLTIGAIDLRPLSEGAQALMPVHIRSRRGVNEKLAKQVLAQARKLSAPYPTDPFVQLRLAEAEIDANNLAEADQAAERVLAADPDNIEAMIYRGRVAVARLVEAKSEDGEAWKAARRWFTRANRADPGAPEPMIHFYASFQSAGHTPTANAAEGLRAAFALAPEDSGLRLRVARQYLRDEKAGEARATLAPAAFDPHGGPLAALAKGVVEAIDSGGAAQALKVWTAAEEDAKKPTKGDQPAASRFSSSILRSSP